MEVVRAIGLMSGTSLDGVDAALVETDGERVEALGATAYRPYSAADRQILKQALADARELADRNARPGVLAQAEAVVTAAHADAVETLLRDAGISRRTVAVVGFHGQTVLHRPAQRLTIQLGDGEALASALDIPVVYDFRAADIAAGGQGAPLVPIFHHALAQGLGRRLPLGVLNIGGVANVTLIDRGEPAACDTGPGNALLDDFMQARTGTACDTDGAAAGRGRVDEGVIAGALADPFFSRPCPKSLDRNHFVVDVSHLTLEDGAATLTALTTAAIAAVVPRLREPPESWIVAGGGARNPTMMRMLAARLAPARVETAATVGWSVDCLEAQAFAFLAVRSLRNLPISFPATTGAPGPTCGGVLASPRRHQVAV